MGLKHYVPFSSVASGESTSAPGGYYIPEYNVESFMRYPHVLREGELVCVTEKIHGASGRRVFQDFSFDLNEVERLVDEETCTAGDHLGEGVVIARWLSEMTRRLVGFS